MLTEDARRSALCWAVLSHRQRRLWHLLAAGTPVSIRQARWCARTHAQVSVVPWLVALGLVVLAASGLVGQPVVLLTGASTLALFALFTDVFALWFLLVARRMQRHVL